MVHQLFVYGKLRDKSIRCKITGRKIEPLKTGFLNGYALSSIQFDGEEYPIVFEDPKTTVAIEGEVIEVTPNELNLIDKYEGTNYRRIKVMLKDGSVVWVYTG